MLVKATSASLGAGGGGKTRRHIFMARFRVHFHNLVAALRIDNIRDIKWLTPAATPPRLKDCLRGLQMVASDTPPCVNGLAAPCDRVEDGLSLVASDASALAGRWVEIAYEASLLAPLERPQIVFRGAEGQEARVFAAAPAFGRGAWIGRVPVFARSVWIWRGGGVAAARFRIVAARAIGLSRVVARAFDARPGLAFLAARAFAVGDAARAERRLVAALAARPLAAGARWARARRRPIEWDGLDAPPQDPLRRPAPHLRLIVDDTGRDWIGALGEAGPEWSMRRAGGADALGPLIADLADNDLVAAPGAAFALAPEAAALFRECARDGADVIYADEAGAGGVFPRLKPDWGPILAAGVDLAGQCWAARAGWLRARFDGARLAELRPLRLEPEDRVVHLRRVLGYGPPAPRVSWPPPDPGPPAPALSRRAPRLSVVIATRDRFDLLADCLASLPRRDDLEIVIVNNGGRAPQMTALLERAARERRAQVLDDPAPFNFSRLSNLGAAAARGATLIFLNDDVEARDDVWIDLMAGWAGRAEIGAVGAKLLYRDRRLQHAGVTLGLGGRAGHVERFLGADDPGYFGRLRTPHEVSAVTAACMAVEARKFAAVGGFDAVNLPVDLNDVDLCLRLAERGWGCVLEPRAQLIHHESASRGADVPAATRYRAEIAYFHHRWWRRLAADPYYHPALSLALTMPALD